MTCNKCGEKPVSAFSLNRTSKRGYGYACRDCQREYRREYILPALRGRGSERVMPEWVQDLVHKPKTLPGKVIRFADYVTKDGEMATRAVVAGRRK